MKGLFIVYDVGGADAFVGSTPEDAWNNALIRIREINLSILTPEAAQALITLASLVTSGWRCYEIMETRP